MGVSLGEATPARVAARLEFNSYSHHMLRPRRNQKVTAIQRGEIATRYREGEDAKELAIEYGISASYVRTLGSR